MRSHYLAIASLLTLLSLTGCPSATPSSPSYGSATQPSASSTGLGGLIRDTGVTPEEQALRDTLVQAPALKFPARLGILFYGYQTSLKAEDKQVLLAKVRDELVATGLVRSAFQIPETLLSATPSLSTLRSLAAHFQVDVVLLLSGQGGLQLADAQPTGGFFDAFSNKAWYEGRASVDGLAIDVATGLFIGSFKAAGQDGPQRIDRDTGFETASYPMRLKAETIAIENAKQRLIDSLSALRGAH
jgi:hypothetical protein